MKYFLATLIFLSALSANAQLNITKLTCEYMEHPPVVDKKNPRLSWINLAGNGEKGQKQTAYQIVVASSIEALSQPNLWDSGKIISESSSICYDGKPLSSALDCYWRVRVWDKNDQVSEWSPIAKWHMGLLQAEDWKAQWIGAPWQGEEAIPKPPGGPDKRTEILPPPAPLLRKSFVVAKKIEKAVVYTTGLGYFEFYANGKKVSEDLLTPNQTNYDKRPALPEAYISLPDEFRDYHVMYLAYDLTDLLSTGENVIGAILGNGFYNAPKFWTASYGSPRFIAQLQITYGDGSQEVIVSDTTWKTSKSAIISDLVFDGEIYDARKEQPDWCKPGFNDSSWENAINRRIPYGRLVAHTAPTDRITKIQHPVRIEKLANGNYKVDFLEEVSGWVRLKNVSAPAGHQIKITFNGNLYSGENTYTFNGKENQEYAPRFNWFVFSSVEISNWYGELKPENIQAEAVNTDVKENAIFETSSTLFNQINHIWKRSQMDNMHGGIASDCPHRERSGYTGDGQVACHTVMSNFDARAFYKKWLNDMLSAQIPATGYIPNGAPWQPGCGGGVAWGAAIHIIPWEFYLYYGDKGLLQEYYDGMTGYMKYMYTWVDEKGIMFSQRTGHDGKPLKWWNLGDWAGFEDHLPPDSLVHTFYFWLCADITAKTAQILGNEMDARFYKTLAENTRKAFIKNFYDPEKGTFGKYGANIFALKMGLEKEQYEKVIQAFKNDFAEAGGHIDTGIFGTRYFFEVLAENGLNDLAFIAMSKTTYPGYGHWVELGSTTSREHWNKKGSHNHPMFGGGLSWFYKHLAGVQIDEQKPGYKNIIFKPIPIREITSVKYQTESNFGNVGIEWKTTNGYQMTVEVPVGSTATVYFPNPSQKTVTESGTDITKSPYIKNIRTDEGYQVFEIESGAYDFRVN